MGGWTVASLGQFGPVAPGTNHDGCRSGSGDSDSSPANAVGSNPAGVEPTQINVDEARNFLLWSFVAAALPYQRVMQIGRYA
jgi:hypothetical protein